MTVVISGADAVPDRLCDLVERAAPKPIVVDEIWIAFGAAAAGAVAWRAIVGKAASAKRAGEVKQFRRGFDVLQRSGGEPRHHWAPLLLQFGELGCDHAACIPMKQAGAVGRDQRPGRID